MKYRRKKLRLNTENTSRLLGLGLDRESDTTSTDPNDQKEQQLLDILRSKLPLRPALEIALPEMAISLAEELESLSGSTLGELLLNSKTYLKLLKKIKDYAKQLGASATGQIEREVMLVVYYAAIAAALIYHDSRISEHSYKDLKTSFNKLLSTTWILPSLTELFEKARLNCEAKTKQVKRLYR
jgi:hypothetical protein